MSISYRLFRIEQWFRQVKCRLFRRKHFLSFVEEFVLNPDYAGYVGGRIEVYSGDPFGYASNEIRFFTMKVEEFRDFREKWDFADVTDKQLVAVEKRVAKEFYAEAKD